MCLLRRLRLLEYIVPLRPEHVFRRRRRRLLSAKFGEGGRGPRRWLRWAAQPRPPAFPALLPLVVDARDLALEGSSASRRGPRASCSPRSARPPTTSRGRARRAAIVDQSGRVRPAPAHRGQPWSRSGRRGRRRSCRRLDEPALAEEVRGSAPGRRLRGFVDVPADCKRSGSCAGVGDDAYGAVAGDAGLQTQDAVGALFGCLAQKPVAPEPRPGGICRRSPPSAPRTRSRRPGTESASHSSAATAASPGVEEHVPACTITTWRLRKIARARGVSFGHQGPWRHGGPGAAPMRTATVSAPSGVAAPSVPTTTRRGRGTRRSRPVRRAEAVEFGLRHGEGRQAPREIGPEMPAKVASPSTLRGGRNFARDVPRVPQTPKLSPVDDRPPDQRRWPRLVARRVISSARFSAPAPTG